MLSRLIATVAALLLACASPQAQAHVRAERLSVSLADLARAAALETASPAKTKSDPETAPPARATAENSAPRKNVALTHCRVGENWSPLQECASMPGVYQWDGTRLAGRTNATGSTLGDYQHAYGWAITSREGAARSTLHTDVHGTPQLITDGTGAIAGWTRTDVWGVEKASTGAQSRLGHTGYLKDPLLGDELYAQARQYRAGVGRFTSRDEWAGDNLSPITLNKYLYGAGNPGTFLDPDGRQSIGINVHSCAEDGGCSSASTSSMGLHLLNPSQMGTTKQADALRESQARSVLFNGGRTDSAMVAGPLIASGAGQFETPYIASRESPRLSVMQSSADLDRSLGVETNYVPYGLGTEAAGEVAFHSIPPVAMLSGGHTMATAESGIEFMLGATEFVSGAVPMGFALHAEMAAFRSQRAFVAASQQNKPLVLTESPSLGVASESPAHLTLQSQPSPTVGQQVYGPHYNEALALSKSDPDFFPNPDTPGTRIVQGSELSAARADYVRDTRQGLLPKGHHRLGLVLGGDNSPGNIQYTGESTISRALLQGLDLGFYKGYGKPNAKTLKLHMTSPDGVLVFGNNPRHVDATNFQNVVRRWQVDEGLRHE